MWVWANSRRWWRTGNPGMLQSMGSQRVRHNWAGEQQPTLEAIWKVISSGYSVATWLHLLLGRKVMTNIDSVLKSRGITLPTKDHIVKARIFPVVMYGCESWTIKKSECWRTDDFKTVVLGKILESPLDCKEINQSERKSTLNIHWKGSCSS